MGTTSRCVQKLVGAMLVIGHFATFRQMKNIVCERLVLAPKLTLMLIFRKCMDLSSRLRLHSNLQSPCRNSQLLVILATLQ